MNKMMKLFLVLVLGLSASAFAKSKVESWKGGEELRYVVRDADGLFEQWGYLSLESWNDGDDRSVWTARHADGTFATGFKGYTEKFKVKAGAKEHLRLVIRNAKGHFVAWTTLDDKVTARLEKMDYDQDGKQETIFAVRMSGKLLNWAPAKTETWANFSEDVLVVRDTADQGNNGKLLAWIAPEKMANGQVVYRMPYTTRNKAGDIVIKKGEFLSANID